MDGSNCIFVGDEICDILLDYNFVGISCNWIEEILDFDGILVNLEEKLMMGYFLCDKDDYFFSEM